MGLFINTNVASINAQRSLSRSSGDLGRSFQRLSSGLRINSARDDAAGLAVASRMTSQLRGLNQAVRNANDGVSFAQTADSALGSTSENLQRIRELAVQAGNGTLTDSDRGAIQSEIDQLTEEIDRVAGTTTFNGQKILDGSFQGRSFQVGANANESIRVEGTDARSQRLGEAAATTSAQIDPSGIDAGELSLNGVAIRATQAGDDTASSTQNQGSAIAVAAAINGQTGSTGVTATVNATEVTGAAVGGGDLDSNNQLLINGTAITSVTVSAGDAGDDLIDAINAAAEDTGVTASRDVNGGVALRAEDGRNVDVQTTGNAGNITGLAAATTTGTVTLTSEDAFDIGGADPADAGFAAGLVGVNRSASLESIDVGTQEGASRALDVVDRALAQVNGSRSQFGALQNRFESSISNLSNISENLSAANSRIADADFATESANLSRQLILQQANISVLAQANASNASALTLLGI